MTLLNHKKISKTLLLFTLLLANTSCVSSQENNNKTNNSAKNINTEEIAFIKERINIKYANLLSGNIWTLTHTYQSRDKMEEVLELSQNFFIAIDKPTDTNLQKIGGIDGGKKRFAKYLESDDDTIKGFAAIMLGIIGDKKYAPQIANILDERDESFTEKFSPKTIISRRNAAIAIGILDAKEFTSKVAALLKSKNNYDRSGAITALGYLENTDYAKEIISFLSNESSALTDDDSPLFYLLENNLADKYKDEIADAMLKTMSSEISESAAYTLVKIEAFDKSADISKLLTVRFRKGFAAKALALMNAKKYSSEIAKLLSDENSLVRKDAVLALGILNAKQFAPQVSALLKAEEDFVRYYAAVSLVLMNEGKYFDEAIPIIEETQKNGAYLNDDDFHPIVLEKSREIKSRFDKLVKDAKAKD